MADKRCYPLLACLFEEEMKMIGHEDESEDLNKRIMGCFKFLHYFLSLFISGYKERGKLQWYRMEAIIHQSSYKSVIFSFIGENRLSSNAAIVYMIILARNERDRSKRHNPSIGSFIGGVKGIPPQGWRVWMEE